MKTSGASWIQKGNLLSYITCWSTRQVHLPSVKPSSDITRINLAERALGREREKQRNREKYRKTQRERETAR